MKKIKTEKKLKLTKKTITNLDKLELNQLRGGTSIIVVTLDECLTENCAVTAPMVGC